MDKWKKDKWKATHLITCPTEDRGYLVMAEVDPRVSDDDTEADAVYYYRRHEHEDRRHEYRHRGWIAASCAWTGGKDGVLRYDREPRKNARVRPVERASKTAQRRAALQDVDSTTLVEWLIAAVQKKTNVQDVTSLDESDYLTDKSEYGVVIKVERDGDIVEFIAHITEQ